MLNGFVYLDRVRSQQEIVELRESAKQEDHGVFFPTHPLRKNGEIVGYFSINPPGVVQSFAWLSTKVQPRESFHLINTVEGMVMGGGGHTLCFPVPKTSPFHSLMEEMGYKNAGEYTFWVKTL